ncbi:MAG: alpha/beta hydrolase [Lapillicoccus sp.]
MVCRGAGTPAVVLLAGGRDDTSTWDPLVTRLGPAVRTCAFDYPGVGSSAPSSLPMTADVVASSLHDTLAAARVATPYVLVGHSLAGLSVRAFVGRYPLDVAGVVLFDPTPVEYLQAHLSDFGGIGWDMSTTVTRVSAVTRWPATPTTILSSDPAVEVSAGLAPADEREWQIDQRALATLSRGTFLVVPGAGHYIFKDKPAAAATAVLTVVAQAG